MAATSKVLGTVTSVVGEVRATASDGTTRILQVGDKVFSDEVITTSANGDVKIALEGVAGKTLECGNDTVMALNEGLLGLGTAVSQISPVVPPSVAATQETATPPAGKPAAGPADVAALQAQIAAGADPSQVAEATAAGGAPGAGGAEGGGSHQPVVVEQGNRSGDVGSGFNTRGGSIDFPNPQINELPPEEGAPVVSVSVEVQVQVQVQVNVDVSVETGVEVLDGPPEGGVFAVSAGGDAVSLIEGTAEGTLEIPFVITLSQVFDTDVQVTYQIVAGTASNPTDFFDGPLTQTITIPAGESSFIVPIQIVRDHFVEGHESFSIVLIDAVNATINPDKDTATVTIFNDDALPVANADTNWVQEDAFVGEGEAPQASGNVLLSQIHPGDPSAVLAFADAADTDFEPLTVSAVNGGAANVGVDIAGSYGTLVLNADGGYAYTLNNDNADVQALDDGETLTDTFDYSVSDGFNAPDSATLTITIFGTNDAPVARADTNWALEDGVDASGNVLQTLAHNGAPSGMFGDVADTDVDVEALTVSAVNGSGANVGQPVVGLYGTLTLNSDGSYTYVVNDANATVNALDTSESISENFAYTASDGDANSASATLTITIFGSNDAPVARADTNWVLEDHEVSSVATGNVLQDMGHSGAPEGSFADVADTDVDIENLTVTAGMFEGEYGTLVLNSDGSYTYTLDNTNEEVQLLADGQTLMDSFNYMASDGTASVGSTLTITIFGTNDGPSLGSDTARVSEEGLGGGITDEDGNTDTTNSASASGQIAVSDSDGDPLTVSLLAPSGTLTSGGTTIEWSGSGTQTLVGSADSNTIITITIDNSGNYTVELSGPIDHSDSSSEDERSFTVPVSATDGDGVSNGALVVTVEDDSPMVSAVAAGSDALQVDETNLAIDATADFSGLFTEAFGADGEGSLTYALGINAGSTGLVDTASGETVTLQISAGVVQGVISGNVIVFTVSVDADGVVTLDQQRAVRHDPNTTSDQETSLAAANLITLTATAADNDGDSDAATVNLGHAISFKDDGPNIDVADAGLPELVVDETDLSTNDTESFAGMFTNIDHGEDGAGTLTYALGVNAGSTGLVDTATGQAVTLHLNGAVVEGRVSDGEGGSFIVFTVSVDGSGNVTLDQQRAVMHTPDAGPDQPATLSSADLITLTATITDKDGDSDSETLDIAQALTFEDDGPSIDITAGATTVVEGQSINNGAWASDAGEDGGVVKVRFNGTDYNLDEAINTGKGTLTVNSNGTWTFTAANDLDQDVAQNISFDLRITDADGDLATDSHTISITDGAGPAASAPQSMLVDEAALSDGANPSSPDEVDTATLTFTSGSDAITSITFGSTGGINVSGLDETQSITWVVSNGGRTLTGSIGGDPVIRIDLTGATTVAAGGSSGNVTATATLLNNMLHQNSPDSDSLVITGVQVVAADPDGDTATFTFTGVTVNDDAPTVTALSGSIENDVGESLAGLVDYDMNADGLGGVTLNAPTVTSDGQPHTLTSNGHTIVYQITDDGGDGLQELKAYADNDGNGFDEGDTLVFTLAPTDAEAADGSYTLTMHDVVDLPVPIISLTFDNIFSPNQIDDRVAIQDSTNGPSNLLISAVNDGDKVTDSANFVGIHNNVMNAGETIRYEFGTVDLTSGDATFMTVTEKKLVNDVQLFSFNTGGSPDSFSWIAYKDGAQVGSGSVTPTTLPQGNSGALFPAIHVDGGYDTLEFTVAAGSEFKVGGVTYTELGDPQDVNLNVVFGGSDADGDPISGSFDVTITGGDGTAESNIIQTLLNNNQPL